METKKEENTEGGNNPQKINPGDDINANLGKFDSDNTPPDLVTPNPTLASQAIEEENVEEKKERKFKIDFEKFNRRKQVASKNALGIKMDMWLRNKKSFILIWLIILAVVIAVLVTQITLPIFVNKGIHNSGNGPWEYTTMKNLAKTTSILAYICFGLIPLPFLFLLTTWIIGINAVAKSRIFHYVLWFILVVAVICMIISLGCGGYVLNDINSYHKSW